MSGAVTVGPGLGVAEGVDVLVGLGVPVLVATGDGVPIGVAGGVGVPVLVATGDGVLVGVAGGVGVPVLVTTGDGVLVGVAGGVRVGDGVRAGVDVGVGVEGPGVGDAGLDGVAEGIAVAVLGGTTVGVTVGEAVVVGAGLEDGSGLGVGVLVLALTVAVAVGVGRGVEVFRAAGVFAWGTTRFGVAVVIALRFVDSKSLCELFASSTSGVATAEAAVDSEEPISRATVPTDIGSGKGGDANGDQASTNSANPQAPTNHRIALSLQQAPLHCAVATIDGGRGVNGCDWGTE